MPPPSAVQPSHQGWGAAKGAVGVDKVGAGRVVGGGPPAGLSFHSQMVSVCKDGRWLLNWLLIA